MVTALFATLAYVRAFLIARHLLAMEAAALRQQLAVYKRKQPRPKLNRFDHLFWLVVRRIAYGPKTRMRRTEAIDCRRDETITRWRRRCSIPFSSL